jgi:hypothetical protein
MGLNFGLNAKQGIDIDNFNYNNISGYGTNIALSMYLDTDKIRRQGAHFWAKKTQINVIWQR